MGGEKPVMHFAHYEDGKVVSLDDESYLWDGKWKYWYDCLGNYKLARMKMDTIDHFCPPSEIKEKNIIGWSNFEV